MRGVPRLAVVVSLPLYYTLPEKAESVSFGRFHQRRLEFSNEINAYLWRLFGALHL